MPDAARVVIFCSNNPLDFDEKILPIESGYVSTIYTSVEILNNSVINYIQSNFYIKNNLNQTF